MSLRKRHAGDKGSDVIPWKAIKSIREDAVMIEEALRLEVDVSANAMQTKQDDTGLYQMTQDSTKPWTGQHRITRDGPDNTNSIDLENR